MERHWRPDKGERKLVWRKLIIACTALLVLAAAIYFVGQKLESGSEAAQSRGDLSDRFTETPAIEYNGVLYRPYEKLTTVLVMGVDHYTSDEEQGTPYRNGGQSDYLMLLVINEETATVTPIQIDRDTMAEITIISVLGNKTGTRTAQICLSHGFGDGREQSCLLTEEAVSNLLLGVPIQFYFALDLKGISVLNDFMGGVTVTLQDDFTSLDPTMARGRTLTLRGIQAEYFVRNRLNIGIGTNESRMVRQQAYMDGLSGLVTQRLASEGSADFVGSMFDQLQDYLLTDMKRGRMINEVWASRDYQRLGTLHPKGTYATGSDGFVEFHADPDALEALVFKVFYRPVS
ncbi:MAG: LCP family protein [Clostridiales bacterium]|nr:LCP family protein [Clostridiales bacterium]